MQGGADPLSVRLMRKLTLRKGLMLPMKWLSSFSFLSPSTKCAFIIAAHLSVLLHGCATSQSHLDQIILVLNKDGGGSQHLSDDLFALNQRELADVEQQDNRELKNKFFFDRMKELNRAAQRGLPARNSPDYKDLAMNVLKQTRHHFVASPSRVTDFEDGDQIGFCFARALLIHYLLLKGDVPQCDIHKIFAIGELMVDHRIWKFHVAVMLHDKGQPLVIDPLFEQPVPLEEWIAAVENLDIKFPYPRVRFYITDPRKFLPASGAYALEDLMNPHLRAYFEALSAHLD